MLTPALYGVAVLSVVGLAVLERAANRVVRPMPREPEVTVPDLGISYDDVVIPSGAHRLHAWLLRPEGELRPPLLLVTHGWGANYGTLLPLVEPLVERGYEVLLFDIRGHGRNAAVDSATIRDFRDDVTSVARWARERFPGRPLVLLGHSLGGSAGVLAVVEGAPLDALGLLASPAEVMEVTARYMSDRGMPGPLLVRLLRPFWWLRLKGSFRPLTPGRRVSEVRVPMLVVQPELDHRVPFTHAERLASAPGAVLRVVPGAGHTDVLAREETREHVLDFLGALESGPRVHRA